MKKIILDRQKIAERVTELGRQISHDFRNDQLILIGVLNGAFIFMADLARAIDLPLQIDFIRVASYGMKSSSGRLAFMKDVELPLDGKNILLVEDIIDTGRTITRLKQHFQAKGAASVRVCALIDKKERREVEVEADYTGFSVPEGFLVGYGLDFAEQHRNLADVYHLDPAGES
ncbi:MAG: hypoxanthine phosphoribosyltransferase [Desulfobulbaceae bacterium DB1]|nr:MAG: hypoxanthine phosphoribosyltransferase [Desulfobulbaceae bacterium DB1]